MHLWHRGRVCAMTLGRAYCAVVRPTRGYYPQVSASPALIISELQPLRYSEYDPAEWGLSVLGF